MYSRLIYALIDPFSGELRYIGLSTRGLSRPKEHWEPSRIRDCATHKCFWVRSIINKGLKPIIRVIQSWESISDKHLRGAEEYWICYFHQQGCRLTNTTGGGELYSGWSMSLEVREKISKARQGIKFSEQHKENISKAAKDRITPPWSKERCERGTPWLRGRKCSPETKLKMSEAQKGKKMSGKARRALLLANIGSKHSEAHKQKIASALKGRIPWNKSKNISEETKEKISRARKGIKFSDEHKKNISKAAKKREENKRINKGIA